MKLLTFLILMALSLPIMMPEPVYEVGGYEGTGEKLESLGEKPMTVIDDSDTWDEHTCLSRAIYFESKGESDRGKILVAQTTINRMNSDKKYFPNTICQLVKQRTGKRCTYSWFCDGKSDRPKDLIQYEKSEIIADKALKGEYSKVTKALYFKRCTIVSRFFDKLKYLGREGNHCFFNEY